MLRRIRLAGRAGATLGNRYEIQELKSGRWVSHAEAPSSLTATQGARALIREPAIEGARAVMLEAGRQPTILFEHVSEGRTKPIKVHGIERAPICVSVEDVFAWPARMVIGRLLRTHLDDLGLTPLQFLNQPGHVRRLMRADAPFAQAMQRIAAVQAKAEGGSPADRMRVLYDLAGKYAELARNDKAAKILREQVTVRGLAPTLTAIKERHLERGENRAITVALAAFLDARVGAESQLTGLAEVVDGSPQPAVTGPIDEAVSEILAGAHTLQTVLGARGSLGEALELLARMANGHPSASPQTPGEEALSRLVNSGPMPRLRAVLLNRVASGLAGLHGLMRHDPTGDGACLDRITSALETSTGMLGGPDMAEAVFKRTKSTFGRPDQDLPSDQTIARMIKGQPSATATLRLLSDLAVAPSTRNMRPLLASYARDLLRRKMTATEIIHPDTSERQLESFLATLPNRLSDLEPASGDAELLHDLLRSAAVELGLLTEADQDLSAATVEEGDADRGKPPVTAGLRTLSPGEFLFHEGEDGDAAFAILAGEVEVLRERGAEQLQLALLQRGDVVGEMALIDRQSRMASARAVGEVSVMVMPEAEFQRSLNELAESNRFIMQVMRTLCERLRAMADR